MLNDKYKSRCKMLKENGLANEELNNYENFKDIMSRSEFDRCMKNKQNRKNKRYRCKKKYFDMLKVMNYRNRIVGFEKVYVIFISMTLDDKNLNQQERTYTKKMNEWLKEHCIAALVNKDFGSRTEREHYHAIAITDNELRPVINEKTGKQVTSKKGNKLYNFARQDYTLGFEPDIIVIETPKMDENELVNYLLKLNNHSNKATTKNRVRFITNWKYKFTEKAIKE